MATRDLATMDRNALIWEAGMLNNHWALVNTDHVTFMALLDEAACRQHVEKLRRRVAEAELEKA